MATADLALRKKVLQHIVDKYGEFKIARTSAKELAKLQPTIGEDSVVLTRKMLSRDPAIITSLGLSTGLADGNKSTANSTTWYRIRPPGKRYAYRLKGSRSSRCPPRRQRIANAF